MKVFRLTSGAVRNAKPSSSSIKIGAHCPRGSDGLPLHKVILCRHANFQGCIVLTGSVSNLGSTSVGNDAASSLRVNGNYVVLLWQNTSYGGACERFARFDADLSDNDQASSLQVGGSCPTQYVSHLDVISGDSAGIGCPSGYLRRGKNLNEGAGGGFVFLCLKFTGTAGETTVKEPRGNYQTKRAARSGF